MSHVLDTQGKYLHNNTMKLRSARDIVVGKKYRHRLYPGVVYMGVGTAHRTEVGRFTGRKLVIIEDNTHIPCIGHICATNKDFLSHFEPLNS